MNTNLWLAPRPFGSFGVQYFFFPRRRRHTSCVSDWSSDVCSSDLLEAFGVLDCRYIVSEEWQRRSGSLVLETGLTAMKREMKLVLVTGASGFLGRAVT